MRTLDPLMTFPTLFQPLTAMGATYRGMVADFLRFFHKVIRINRDTVTAHKPEAVLVKVPLGAGSLEDFIRADAEPGKDHGELVHQRNVEVTLDILE